MHSAHTKLAVLFRHVRRSRSLEHGLLHTGARANNSRDGSYPRRTLHLCLTTWACEWKCPRIIRCAPLPHELVPCPKPHLYTSCVDQALTRVFCVCVCPVASNTINIAPMPVLQCRTHKPQTRFKSQARAVIVHHDPADVGVLPTELLPGENTAEHLPVIVLHGL